TAHEELRLVELIPKRIAGIAEHHEVAVLAHEGGHVAYIAMNDDVDALHRDAAARRRIALDDKEAAAMAQIPLAGTNWYPGKGGY
ncbi:hypothetical protein ACC676_38825, partial [Rhizobium ruizarguesonis]